MDEDEFSSLPKQMQRLLKTSKLEGKFSYIQMEIVTFEDLWIHGETIVGFIEYVWQSLLPSPIKLQASWNPRAKPWDKKACRYSGIKPHFQKWKELKSLILAGELDSLGIVDWDTVHSRVLRFDADVYIGVNFGEAWAQMQGHRLVEAPKYDPREAKMLKLCLNTRILDGVVSTKIQEQLAFLATKLFQDVNGACGYIHLGDEFNTLAFATHHETINNLAGQGASTWMCCDEVRGAFWLNFLSGEHVRRLGGMEKITREAPCYKVAQLDRCDTKQVEVLALLQLTPMMTEMSVQQLEQLEHFLKPILISPKKWIVTSILDHRIVQKLEGIEEVRAVFAKYASRIVHLPLGAMLIEYNKPGYIPIRETLQKFGSEEIRASRDIPKLRLNQRPDDAIVFTVEKLIPPRRKFGPIFPYIGVQSCLQDHKLKFQIDFSEQPTHEQKLELRKLVEEWKFLSYEVKSELLTISACSVVELKEQTCEWYAELDPVGQDAYFQLVLMLDHFSQTIHRLLEVKVLKP